MSRVLQRLQSFSRRRPLLFNSVVYGSFYTGAEFAQQSYSRVFKLTEPAPENFEESMPPRDTGTQSFAWIKKFNETLGLLDGEASTRPENYNWAQLKRYAIYGCFLAGPVLHGWYKWLDTFYKGKSMRTVLTKLFADQFLLTPPLITMFFVSMSLMEGRTDVLGECKLKFLHTFKTSCMYWLPVQFLNFLLVPSALRVSFVSIAAFCWVNILCYLKNKPLPQAHRSGE